MKARTAILLMALTSSSAFAESLADRMADTARGPVLAPTATASLGSGFSAQDLVGRWAMEASRNGVVLRTVFSLEANGTFAGGITANGNSFVSYAGTWELVGDRLNWLYTTSSVPLPEEAKKDTDQVLSVSPSTIEVLSLRSGEKRTLRRM